MLCHLRGLNEYGTEFGVDSLGARLGVSPFRVDGGARCFWVLVEARGVNSAWRLSTDFGVRVARICSACLTGVVSSRTVNPLDAHGVSSISMGATLLGLGVVFL